MMPTTLGISRRVQAFLLACLTVAVVAGPGGVAAARAQSAVAARQTIALDVSAGKLVRLPAPAATVFVADPAIADVQTPGASAIFVFGKKPGRTTLFALGAGGAPVLAATIEVRYDQAQLQALLAAAAGSLPVRLAYTPEGAVLTGAVPTAEAAERLRQQVAALIGPGQTLLDQLRVSNSVQVNLRVRVAEVSRSVSQTIGINWNALFSVGSFAFGLETGRFASAGSTLIGNGLNGVFGSVASKHANVAGVLDAMAQEGLVTMLAEPNLTAISGEKAEFLAGGEFPVPIPQALGVTSVEYKSYGVSVSFAPTVLASGLISIKVRPEVSALSAQGAVTLNGFQIPALVTRRAETTVELASGQSFAIAGLIQNDAQNNINRLPWLSDIPVLGALFRSNQFQRNQTELVIVVTPYVVQPAERTPVAANDLVGQPSELERLLFGRVAARRVGAPYDPEGLPRLRGEAGFLFE